MRREALEQQRRTRSELRRALQGTVESSARWSDPDIVKSASQFCERSPKHSDKRQMHGPIRV
jgi:hypothetical protein